MEPMYQRSQFTCRQCLRSRLAVGPHRPRQAAALGRVIPAAQILSKTQERSQRRTATTAARPGASASRSKNEKSFWENDWTVFSADNAALVKKAQEFGDRVLQAKGIPEDTTVAEAMQVIEFAAAQLVVPAKEMDTSGRSRATREELDANSANLANPAKQAGRVGGGFLSLERSKEPQIHMAHPMSISISTKLLSSLAYKILCCPAVFISPELLASYVKIQALLKAPQTIPEAFYLYANKPVPVSGTNPIKYTVPRPNSIKQAIPKPVAEAALQIAIDKKNLDLAVAIIESSVTKPAFRRRKFMTKAFPTIAAISTTPVAAGIVASRLPQYFPIADPAELVTYTTIGITTYIGGLTMLGFVAITTANDHFERVVWAPGTALRERWLREDERAAIDRVAMAWGFKEVERRGDEDSEEWEILREYCYLRGMILDKTDLMEGME